MTSGTKPDDLDAVKEIVDILGAFEESEKQRILRWVVEKLSLSLAPIDQAGIASTKYFQPADSHMGSVASPTSHTDIRSFVEHKSPSSDVQFATTVAYYHRFVAPPSERKETINSDDLIQAFRAANRRRPNQPRFTLNNAHNAGLLDRKADGNFAINAVGENLVAMTLPGAAGSEPGRSKRKLKKARSSKKKKGKAARTK